MKYWGGRAQPAWVREIAQDRGRPLSAEQQTATVSPRAGDIVLKPFIDQTSFKQLFRLETWQTHDLLDGPFQHVREALEAAFELGVTARLAVWLDYSDNPKAHDLDSTPLYFDDKSTVDSASVA